MWTADGIHIPSGGGKHRLTIEQYEVLPTDKRKDNVYKEDLPARGLRMLYQDQIPL